MAGVATAAPGNSSKMPASIYSINPWGGVNINNGAAPNEDPYQNSPPATQALKDQITLTPSAGSAAGAGVKNDYTAQAATTPAAQSSSLYASLLPSLMGLMGGGSGASGTGTSGSSVGGSGTAGVSGVVGGGGAGGSGGSSVPQVQMPDMQAANQQAFARAKDTAGNLSRASLDALNGEMGAQGMLGSGGQAEGAANILAKATNTMGAEANTEASTNAGLANTDVLANQSAAVTGRGQDIQQQEAAATLAQAKSAQQQQLLLGILSGLQGSASSSAPTGGLY